MVREPLLAKELQEIHNYIRSFFTIAVTWYTFFIAANLFGLSILLLSITGENEKEMPVTVALAAASGFIAVNLLAVVGCHISRRYLGKTNKRIDEIVAILNEASGEGGRLRSPLPFSLALKASWLVEASLWGVAGGWVVFLIYVV